MVESLPSYLSRLAGSHGLTTAALVRSSLPALLRQTAHPQRSNIGELQVVGERAAGMSGTAKLWANAIGELVDRNLEALTLRGWAPALAPTEYLRRRLAHCPSCLEAMVETGTVYEPLSWSVRQITHCPIHESPLALRCPHCDREQRPLRLRGRPGVCGSCGGWLGDANRSSTVASRYARSRSVAELIPLRLAQEALLQAIQAAIVSAGSQRALALRADVTTGSVSMWRRGILRPSLDAVLALCSSGSWDLAAFVKGELSPGAGGIRSHHAARQRRRTTIDWEATRRVMRELAERPRPPSLAALAADLQIDKRSLRVNLPLETALVVRRHRDNVERLATDRMAALTRAVADVTTELLREGRRASRREVERRLPAGHQLRERALGDAWRAARSEFVALRPVRPPTARRLNSSFPAGDRLSPTSRHPSGRPGRPARLPRTRPSR